MTHETAASRRKFLARTARGIGLAGLGGAGAAVLFSREPRTADELARQSSPGAFTTFSTGARSARRIAVGPHDRIHVAADRAILIFEPDGRPAARRTLRRPARAIAACQDGSLLVAFADHVERLSPDGSPFAAWDRPEGEPLLNSVSVSGENVFVADAGNRVLWNYDPRGQLLRRIEPGPAGFASPPEFLTLVAAADGSVHVGNPARHRIERFSGEGRFVSAWGRQSRDLAGFSGCCNPVSFAVLPDGRFVTAERGQPRIKLYDAQGRFLELLVGPERFVANAAASAGDGAGGDGSAGCHSGGLDVAVDSRGRVLILDRVTADVTIV